jgi:ApbE superfamily uncharacterized protein (UPF0280 family)
MNHKNRFYRDYSSTNRTAFNVKIDTSDLFIIADKNLYDKAYEMLKTVRTELEEYIMEHDEFLHSLDPVTHHGDIDSISAVMCRASASAGVGPMAAVAGAVAEAVGNGLLSFSEEVIVENGGDIWMKLVKPAVIGIYVNNIYFRDNIGIKINPDKTPCSVCTSTSKLGHSLSFGKADSVTIIADTGALADAVATAVCNMVQTSDDIENALNFGMSIKGIRGCLIIFRDILAARGEIELSPLE